MFKKGFLIDLDVEPKTDEDICLGLQNIVEKMAWPLSLLKELHL